MFSVLVLCFSESLVKVRINPVCGIRLERVFLKVPHYAANGQGLQGISLLFKGTLTKNIKDKGNLLIGNNREKRDQWKRYSSPPLEGPEIRAVKKLKKHDGKIHINHEPRVRFFYILQIARVLSNNITSLPTCLFKEKLLLMERFPSLTPPPLPSINLLRTFR